MLHVWNAYLIKRFIMIIITPTIIIIAILITVLKQLNCDLRDSLDMQYYHQWAFYSTKGFPTFRNLLIQY